MKEFVIAFLLCIVFTCWVGAGGSFPLQVGVSGIGSTPTTPRIDDNAGMIPEMNYVDGWRKHAYIKEVNDGTERGLVDFRIGGAD
jgi:hypothetical protein